MWGRLARVTGPPPLPRPPSGPGAAQPARPEGDGGRLGGSAPPGHPRPGLGPLRPGPSGTGGTTPGTDGTGSRDRDMRRPGPLAPRGGSPDDRRPPGRPGGKGKARYRCRRRLRCRAGRPAAAGGRSRLSARQRSETRQRPGAARGSGRLQGPDPAPGLRHCAGEGRSRAGRHAAAPLKAGRARRQDVVEAAPRPGAPPMPQGGRADRPRGQRRRGPQARGRQLVLYGSLAPAVGIEPTTN